MAHGLKLLLLAGGAIISCILVVTGLSLTSMGKHESAIAQGQYTDVIDQYEEWKEYDGRCISGEEVISLIQENQQDRIYFIVKTNLCEALFGVYYNWNVDFTPAGTYQKERMSKTDPEYINPEASFYCSVILNKNDVIVGLKLIQKG